MTSNFWNNVFKNKKWGEYPSEHLVRFVAQNYYRCKNKKKIRILEVGCGAGANIRYLCEQGFDVYGLDYSRVAIKQAQEMLKKNKINHSASLTCSNISNIPFENNFFDLIIDIECLYSLTPENKDLAIKEIYRTLKNKGRGTLFSQIFSDKTTSPILVEKNSIKWINKYKIKNFFPYFDKIHYEIATRTVNNKKYIVEEFLTKCVK